MPALLRLPIGLRLLRRLPLPRKLGLLESLYGEKLGDQGITWVKGANGIVWKLDAGDPTHRWIIFGDYEGGAGLAFARQALKNGGVFVDSGANIGQWLLYLGSLPGLRALEFEPVESQRLWLEECVARHQDWDCTIFNCGLGSTPGRVTIHCDGARSTLRSDWYSSSNLPTASIPIRRLEDVLAEAGITTVELWKLDVEGAEYDALLGAGRYLEQQGIKRIFFECHHTNYRRNKELLESHGYRLYDLCRGKLRPKQDQDIEEVQDLVALAGSAPESAALA